MICGYVRGGRQCSRPGVATVRLAVDTHLTGKGYRLCQDHLIFVLGEHAQTHADRAGSMDVIEWA